MQTAAPIPRPASWHDDLRLGYGPIDHIHEEFVVLVDALLAATDERVAVALTAVHVHSREHFASEEQWMQETDFPARDCHADEHAAVLQSMEVVTRRVAGGDFEAGRHLARALADWFPGHADYLDSALAHWMCQKHLGGKPVLLRRSIATPAA
ncbi:MAG: hemerythrin domain-containing protein [Pseudomonadota bacterium]